MTLRPWPHEGGELVAELEASVLVGVSPLVSRPATFVVRH